jgi:hypothetical protein
MFGAMVYSAIFAAAAVWYGVHGVMEPGVPSLTMRFMFSHAQIYQGLPLLALLAGVGGELALQTFRAMKPSPAQDQSAKPGSAGSQRPPSARKDAKPRSKGLR